MKGNLWEAEDGLSVLEEIFTDEEITWAIWDLGLDKAPSPDGFPIVFFHEF